MLFHIQFGGPRAFTLCSSASPPVSRFLYKVVQFLNKRNELRYSVRYTASSPHTCVVFFFFCVRIPKSMRWLARRQQNTRLNVRRGPFGGRHAPLRDVAARNPILYRKHLVMSLLWRRRQRRRHHPPPLSFYILRLFGAYYGEDDISDLLSKRKKFDLYLLPHASAEVWLAG